jgi:hypothetical protein
MARCAACDGAHHARACPLYGGRPRPDHADAVRRPPPREALPRAAPRALHGARQLPQPADGSCLFHALSAGLGGPPGAGPLLRAELADWIERNGDAALGANTLRAWLRHSHGLDPAAYAAQLRRADAWGGGVEMACLAAASGVAVEVYERGPPREHRLLARFEPPPAGGMLCGAGGGAAVRVALVGGCHYELLLLG